MLKGLLPANTLLGTTNLKNALINYQNGVLTTLSHLNSDNRFHQKVFDDNANKIAE